MKALKWLDANLEKTVILICYSSMALIIVEAVISRFVFRTQNPWSTSVTIYLFLWVTWMGASYNTKMRTQLNFAEVRMRLPYGAQFACLVLDAVLWLAFGVMVTWYTTQQVQLVYSNMAIVAGTDDVMQWWFYAATPIAWGLLMFRVLQNLVEDWHTYRRREPFQHMMSLGD